jgi:hypothetical protein
MLTLGFKAPLLLAHPFALLFGLLIGVFVQRLSGYLQGATGRAGNVQAVEWLKLNFARSALFHSSSPSNIAALA